jgi:hypothetical protein
LLELRADLSEFLFDFLGRALYIRPVESGARGAILQPVRAV